MDTTVIQHLKDKVKINPMDVDPIRPATTNNNKNAQSLFKY